MAVGRELFIIFPSCIAQEGNFRLFVFVVVLVVLAENMLAEHFELLVYAMCPPSL